MSSLKLSNSNGKQTIISSGDSLQDITLDGSKLLKQIDTIADLRDLTETPSTVYVKAYDNSGNTEGAFGNHFFGLATDTGQVDNGGTIIRTVNGVYELQYDRAVSVKWFGAVGDGTTDDTVALQKALLEAELLVLSKNGSGIDFAGGNYITSDTLTFSYPMLVEGSGASIYWENSGDSDVIYVNAGGQTAGFMKGNWVIKNFTIAGGDGTGAALHIDTVAYSTFENINIPYCGYGVVLENSLFNKFERVVVSGIAVGQSLLLYPAPTHRNKKGFFLYGGAVTGPNANTFIQCGVQNSTEEAIRCIGGNNTHFIDFDSEGHTGNHLYSDGCINLQFTGGDFEGTSAVSFLNCVGGGMSDSFVNHIVTIGGMSNSVKIDGGLIKIINILSSTCINNIIDNVTLYTGAAGYTDLGTNTYIGRVYDQDDSTGYFGKEWYKEGEAVIDVGGTTTGHTITRNDVRIQRSGGFLFINMQITWSALAGSGNISFDVSSLVDISTTGAIGTLSLSGIRATVPTGYSGCYARITDSNVVQLLFSTSLKTTTDTFLTFADIWPAATGVNISGAIAI